MSQEQEKKNRFQISREVQENFVNQIAGHMLTLAESAGKWKKPWVTEAPAGLPFCATTGRPYSGGNMVNLMLTSLIRGYQEDRWVTFKQLQQFKEEQPDLKMMIRKGESGVSLLRPEELRFIVKEDGKWDYLSDERVKKLEMQKEQGLQVPDIQRLTLFYPFTVFNASQIEGFPAKENPALPMTDVERNEFMERFIACTGVPVEHYNGEPCYQPGLMW